MNVLLAARPLALTAGVLGSCALAHGESPVVNLRGAVLCLDPTSVRLNVEDTPAARQAPIRAVSRTIHRALVTALKAGGVRYAARASCRGSPASTLVLIDVRYLNPKNYVGFGDPAYSYTLSLQVGPGPERPAPAAAKNTAIQFASSWSDIHSEARTKQSVATMLAALGKTQAQDLVRAWRKDNPRAPSGG